MRAIFRHTIFPLLLLGLAVLYGTASAATLVLVARSDQNSPATVAIIDGIRGSDIPSDVRSVDPSMLERTMATIDDQYDAIIVLGRALIAERTMPTADIPVLHGAYHGPLTSQPGMKGISLNVDPLYALAQAEKTGRPIERIWTVASPALSTSLEITRLLASDNAKTDLAVVGGEQETARAWFDALQAIETPSDALYIVDDTDLDSSGTYRFLIEQAWKKDVLVISSVPSLASRGVSIGFIPDLGAYGRLLLRSVRQMSVDRDYTPDPLLDGNTMQRVFNERTLSHIGRRLPSDLDDFARGDIIID